MKAKYHLILFAAHLKYCLVLFQALVNESLILFMVFFYGRGATRSPPRSFPIAAFSFAALCTKGTGH
jgi:hypothetical protein